MSPIRMSRIESAIRTVLDFYAAFNHHDVTGMMKLLSEDCFIETSGPVPDGAVYSGVEAIRGYWEEFLHDSPHARITIEETFGLGLRCLALWKYEWEDADGEKRHIRGIQVFQVKEDLICRISSYVKGSLERD
jgi:ketosteroid isomerase-like protein